MLHAHTHTGTKRCVSPPSSRPQLGPPDLGTRQMMMAGALCRSLFRGNPTNTIANLRGCPRCSLVAHMWPGCNVLIVGASPALPVVVLPKPAFPEEDA
eukprot:285466-Pelagomonas_calceolata.AAC.1